MFSKIFKRKQPENPRAQFIRACDSLLDAATYIEQNPDAYYWSNNIVPGSRAGCVSVLGWAGFEFYQFCA